MSFVGRVISRVTGKSERHQGSLPEGNGNPRNEIPQTPQGRELYNKVAAIFFWFHSIDLGHGVITPGFKSLEVEKQELDSFHLPDLHGKSVLDIGAWDGYFSFTAEKLGAARVVALDKHVWALDWKAKRIYRAECKAKNTPAPTVQFRPTGVGL